MPKSILSRRDARFINLFVGILLIGSTLVAARADVQLPQVFSEHAVLQKAENVPVWGRSAPGEKVVVTLAGRKAETVAGTDGQWRVQLDLRAVGKGPFEMVVQGNNRLTIADVVVGEVWVCSGQSNMALALAASSEGAAEVAASGNLWLRQYDGSRWLVASPETSGGFVAAGYYFGKNIQKDLAVPVGLLSAYQGATAVELWISPEGMDKDPELKAGKDRVLAADQVFKTYGARYVAWQEKFSRQDRAAGPADAFAGPQINAADWKAVKLPGSFAKAGLPDSGAVWVRRQVTVPADKENRDLLLELGDLHDFSTVYWDGVKVGQLSPGAPPGSHCFFVPAKRVKTGDMTLAIRIFSPAGDGGIAPGRMAFKFGGIPLEGEWLARSEFALPQIDEKAKEVCPRQPPPAFPAGMFFECRVRPLISYAIQGVIWYQGEGNTDRAWQYRTAFPLLISDWREHWGRGDFPFYFCQLPSFMAHQKMPGESNWAELREAQAKTLAVPRTGMAVLIDVGEEGDIHPKNKKTVGERLARIAIAETYGKKVVASGPVYKSMKVKGEKIRVRFTHADGGLVARALPAMYRPVSSVPKTVPLVRNSPQSEVEGFALCGEDRKWQWADARIDGKDVVVWSDHVKKPVAVRYAWADNPVCNLDNGAGLPAGPFRTDDFPLSTVNEKY